MMPLAERLDALAPRRESPWRAFDACATAMLVVDHTLAVGFVNDAANDWLGETATHLRGQSVALLDARPPTLADATVRAIDARHRVRLRDARLRSVFGDRAVDLALTPLDDAHVLIELHATVVDSAPSRWSESLRGFAHEIRGPLAGMRGAAQLLKRHVAADQTELAELIVGEVDRLAGLSDRLLSSGGKPRLARSNVHEVIERVVALAEAQSPTLDIRRDYDPSLPPLPVDADRLQQALLNLLRNALEANARSVFVRTRADRGMRIGERVLRSALRIDVGDDGDGVPAALAESLFEPLVSGRADGSGLGLAIAREIAREHGGELTCMSRPGATTFSLLLPLGT